MIYCSNEWLPKSEHVTCKSDEEIYNYVSYDLTLKFGMAENYFSHSDFENPVHTKIDFLKNTIYMDDYIGTNVMLDIDQIELKDNRLGIGHSEKIFSKVESVEKFEVAEDWASAMTIFQIS